MRVLHVDSGREMRGGQHQVLLLLEAHGVEHRLLARRDSPLLVAARRSGIDARPLTLPALLAESRGCDVVHAHDARSHTIAVVTGGAPLIVSRRVAFPIQRSLASRWKYQRAVHYIAVSEHVKATLLDAGIDPARISVVYDGVRIPDGVAHGDLIVAPASADPMKGSDLLREAASLGSFEVRYSSDLAADLPHAAVLVYLTRSEGLGSAALLAMAHGVPVVASRVGGLPEIVEDGVTGVLTENEPRAICAALARALAQREELGANGRRTAVSRHSGEAMARATFGVYEKVLGC